MAGLSTECERDGVLEPLLTRQASSGSLIPSHPPVGVVRTAPESDFPLIDGKHPEKGDLVLKKVARNLVGVCCLVVFLCYVDRANLGLSASELLGDLGWDEEVYATGVSVFFVGYVLFQIPSTMLMERLGTPVWMGISLLAWGFAAGATAFVRTPFQFYVIRFVLGVAESGTFPGIWYYLGLFIPQNRITFSIAAVDVTLVMSQVLAAPMAAGLMSLDGKLGLCGWQWLFLSEGLPTIALAAWFWFRMPRTPANAKFLRLDESEWLLNEMQWVNEEAGMDDRQGPKPVFDQLYQALWNPGLWGCSIIYLLRLMSMYVILFWSVLLIGAMKSGNGLRPCPVGDPTCPQAGEADDLVVLLATIPYSFAAVATLLNGWHSQANDERKMHVAAPFMIGAAVFATVPFFTKVHFALGLIALTVGAVGAVSGGAVLTTIASAQLPPGSKAFGLGLYNAVANIGGVIGPMVTGVLVDRFGSYTPPIFTMAIVLFTGGFLVVFLRDPLAQHAKRKGFSMERSDQVEDLIV